MARWHKPRLDDRGELSGLFRLEVDIDCPPVASWADYWMGLALDAAGLTGEIQERSRLLYWRSWQRRYHLREEALQDCASLLHPLEKSYRDGHLRAFSCRVREQPQCQGCGGHLPWEASDSLLPTDDGSGQIAIGEVRTCPKCGQPDIRPYGRG